MTQEQKTRNEKALAELQSMKKKIEDGMAEAQHFLVQLDKQIGQFEKALAA
jgi:hypothetical protein